MQVSESIRQIKTRQPPIEVEFIYYEECRTYRVYLLEERRREKLYSDDLAYKSKQILRTTGIKPETIEFKMLPPVVKPNDIKERRYMHQTEGWSFLAKNKQKLRELALEVHGTEPTQREREREQENFLRTYARESLQKPKLRVVYLQEQDIYTNKIDIVYLLQLFAHPYNFEADFYSYLNYFTIGQEIAYIKRVSTKTRHYSMVFRDNSKFGIERAQQLRRADSYNNIALYAIEMLAKWCSGYSYLPIKSFSKSFDDYKEEIKKSLKIKFLDKKYSAELPLCHVIPAGEAVDHLTFDNLEMDKLVRQVKEQLQNNVWEPFLLFQQAEVVFKKMLYANAKSKGVAPYYMRCGYENIIYKKFEADFVTLVQMLAYEAKEQGNIDEYDNRVRISLNLSEVIAIVDKLKMSNKPDQEIKKKVGARYDVAFKNVKIAKQNKDGESKPFKKEITKFVVDGLEYNYAGYVRVLYEGEVVEEEEIELSDEVEAAYPEKNETEAEHKEYDEEEQRGLALEQERREEEVLRYMAEANMTEYPQPIKSEVDPVDIYTNEVQDDQYKLEYYKSLEPEAYEQYPPESDASAFMRIEEISEPLVEYLSEPDLPVQQLYEPETEQYYYDEKPAYPYVILQSVVHYEKYETEVPTEENYEQVAQPPESVPPSETLPPLDDPVVDEQTKDFFKPYTNLEPQAEPPISTSSSSSRKRRRRGTEGLSDVSGVSEQSESHSTEGRRSRRRKTEQQEEQYPEYYPELSDVSRSSERRRKHRRDLPYMDDYATVEYHPLNPPTENVGEPLPDNTGQAPYEPPQELPEELPMPPEGDEVPGDVPPEDDVPYELPNEDAPAEEDMLPLNEFPYAEDLPDQCEIPSEDLMTNSQNKGDLMSSIDPNDLY